MSDAAVVPEPPSFSRRVSDVNVESLAVQVRALAERVHVLEEQGRQTARAVDDLKPIAQEVHDAVFGVEGQFSGIAAMARDVHKAVFGVEGKPGVQQVVEQIRDLVELGRNTFRFVDVLSRGIKRFWPIVALVIAVYTFLRTGKWAWTITP